MFKITITKVETKTVTKRGEYTVIDKRPWTDKEISDEMSGIYRSPEQFVEKNPLKQVMGYAPSWEGLETEEAEVLKQTVDHLDLVKVIMAINGIGKQIEYAKKDLQ